MSTALKTLDTQDTGWIHSTVPATI